MNDRIRPPKLALWLLHHFGRSPNNSAIIGDLTERYQEGKNPLWYWKEAIVAIVVGGGLMTIKRLAAWAAVAGLTFVAGFWTARSPWVIHEEMPSESVVAEMYQQRLLADDGNKRSQLRKATLEFLQIELENAKAEDARLQSAVTKKRVQDLQTKLEQAQRAIALTSSVR